MKVLIVDDHAVLLESLAMLLARLIPGVEVLTASDAAEALRLAEACPDLDVLLLDLFMPGFDGMQAVATLRARHPALPVVVLSSSADPAHVRQAMRAGAQGYVPKTADPRTLVSAIRMVLDGELYVPPLMLAPGATATPAGDETGLGLTERQSEVLRLLARGASNKEIAQALGLSDKTVKVHVQAIFKRLGVTKRMQAAERARQASLI